MPVIKAGTMRRKGPGARLAVLYLAAILLTAAFIVFNQTPRHHQLMAGLHDLRHVLLLGFGGLMFLELTALLGRRWIRKRSLYYAVAGVIVLLAAVRIEFNYLPWDTLRYLHNAIGGLAFLLLSAVFDRPLRREHDWLRGLPRRAFFLLAMLILAFIFQPLGPVAMSYAGRSGAFPVIVALTDDWQERFVRVQDAMLFTGRPPPAWTQRKNRQTAMISFEPVPGAGVTVSEVYPDWRTFNTLRFQIYSELPTPVELILRIDDREAEAVAGDRFEMQFVVNTGLNDYEIPHDTIRRGPADRELRLQNVRHVGLYSAGRPERFRLFFSSMRLVDRPRRDAG
jgi:hypothetical protein